MTRHMRRYCRTLATALGRQFPDSENPQVPVPLSRLCRQGRFTVCGLEGDRKTCARIGALGLFPGAEGELIRCGNGHQCILQIHGSRLCLDALIAKHILVR